MANILGIDFGLSKVGLAIATSKLAEPYSIIRYKNIELLFQEIKKITEKEKVGSIVVGISEGEMAKKTREFVKNLRISISLPIEEFDETLSTLDAQRLAIESGMNRRKRKEMEDAMAAAVMLQNYIDS